MKKEEHRLEYMDRMEAILSYLVEHLYEPFELKDIASEYNYSPRYFEKIFEEYYGCGVKKFLSRLRLRRAASSLLNGESLYNEWPKYGYKSSSAFSTAFRQEFGMSPRAFTKCMDSVPFMPVKKELFDVPLYMSYQDVPTVLIGGQVFLIENVREPYIFENMYLGLTEHDDPAAQTTDNQYGILFYDYESCTEQGKAPLFYIHGQDSFLKSDLIISDNYFIHPFTRQHITVSRNPVDLISQEHDMPCYLEIGADHYVVFSIPRFRETRKDILDFWVLLRYIFDEWSVLNQVKTNPMGWTFSKFSSQYITIYVPVEKESIRRVEYYAGDHGAGRWVQYIDNHLDTKLSTESVASHFGYSARHFFDVFKLYYGIAPGNYIRRKRVCIAVKEMQKANEQEYTKILKKYSFGSLEQFKTLYQDIFPQIPFLQEVPDVSVVSLTDYFLQNKARLKMSHIEMNPINISIVRVNDSDENIAAFAEYWLSRSNKADLLSDKHDRIALWITSEEGISQYVVGDAITSTDESDPPSDNLYVSGDGLSTELPVVTIKGGHYAVFEIAKENQKTLKEDYITMTRCVFYSWIKENMFRYDGDRLTFVRFTEGKLLFYVPLIL